MARKAKPPARDVFRDLGFSQEEAESLRIRAALMIEIARLIKSRNLTQAKAAKLMGVTQPRVSDLVRGRVDLFSIDTLVDMAAKAGAKIQLTIKPARRGTKRRQAA